MKEEDESSHIGNYTTKAFALLIIMNNYKAWLHEEKMKHKGNLITEYEVGTNDLHESIVDHWLKDLEFKREINDDCVLLDDKTSDDFERSVRARRDKVENVRSCRRICEFMTKSWDSYDIVEEGECTIDENDRHINVSGGDIIKERDRKRRKMMKGLRRWTGHMVEGKKVKGWSDEGHRKFEDLCEIIRKDVADGKYKIWDNQVRLLYNKKESHCQNETTTRYSPNKSVVWEL